jgi:drug/metabolite transporter (DMT)-like permease
MLTFPPLWFLIALAGHLANGGSFIIDKMLLRRSFRRPATYAGVIGIMSGIALALFPFGVHWPDLAGWFWIGISGATFVLSLWAFFAALAAGETSRVVPVIGSLIPILTLGGTTVLLHERLALTQLGGFGLLIIATIILAGGPAHSRLKVNAIVLAVVAALLFAVSSVTGKVAYEGYGFMTTFVWSRVWGIIAAVAILIHDPEAGTEFWDAMTRKPAKATKSHPHTNRGGHKAVGAFFIGQIMGMFGFVGVQYATSLGSAALVNALQSVQYALLVGVALLLRKKAHLLGEDLNRRTIARKIVAIGLVGLGLWLVV